MMDSNVKKWASDKPPMVATLAIEAVSSADALATVVTNAAEGGRYGAREGTLDLDQWIGLYRGHRSLQRFVLDEFFDRSTEFGDAGVLSEMVGDLQSGVREMSRMDPAELQKELEEVLRSDPEAPHKAGECAKEMHSALFAGDNVLNDDGPAEDGVWSELFAREETLFMLLVWAPCWLQYGEYPPRLMRRARQGTPDALEKLLRLDKRAIYDAKIAQEWAKVSTKRNRYFYRVADALRDPPEGMGASKVKMVLAGFISACSKVVAERMKKGFAESGIPVPAALVPLTKRLTGPSIRDLFDAYQKDLTGDRMAQDDDIPKDNEALKKALQRHRPLWDFLWECV